MESLSGFPFGVVNLVCGLGSGAGEAIVKHKDIRVISFTGSTAVGERIATIAAPMMKKIRWVSGLFWVG